MLNGEKQVEVRKINKKKYFIVFLITTVIFLAGIWVGHLIAEYRFGELENLQMSLKTQTATLETQYLLISQNPCILSETDRFNQELYKMGRELSDMEATYGTDSEDVNMLKEYYSLLELRHWLFLEQIKDKCKQNDFKTILYFYSNLGDCDDCNEQGFVLTYLREKNPELRIYSFDINIDNAALNWIKDSYGIKGVPSLIINGEYYTGFKNEDELAEIIK